MAVNFNTHEFIKILEAGGYSPQQAESMAEAVEKSGLVSEKELTTELVLLRKDLKETELRLEAKINDIKFELVKWIAGMLLAQAGLVAALVKLL